MNASAKLAALLALSWFAAGALAITSPVGVDPGRTWLAYAAYFKLPAQGGDFVFSEYFGEDTAQLQGGFTGDVATLAPNRRGVHVVDTGNPFFDFWWAPDGNGGYTANMSALSQFYAQDDSLAGTTVQFSGQVLSNSLAAPHTANAIVVETVGENYALVGRSQVPLVAGQAFQVSRDIAAGHHVGYGIEVWGPASPDASLGSLGSVSVIMVPEPSAMLLMSLGVLGLMAAQRRRD